MKDYSIHLGIGILLGIGATLLVLGVFSPTTIKREAIELGYARYNPTNANWEWIKPK